MAGHLQIGTITRGKIKYADWINSYERKSVDSAKSKIDYFNRHPMYQKEFEATKNYGKYFLQGKELTKLTDDYLPEELRNQGNIAFSFGAFVGHRDVCGGYAVIEVHYDTLMLKGTVYLVA